MSWSQEDAIDDAEISVWMVQQKKQRRNRMLFGASVSMLALFITWVFSQAMVTVDKVRIQREQWLKSNGCYVTSFKDSEWNYHIFGKYWSRVPGEICYKCTKTGESFCDDT
jgi:hypothetical protein